jgi:hypothetical protein
VLLICPEATCSNHPNNLFSQKCSSIFVPKLNSEPYLSHVSKTPYLLKKVLKDSTGSTSTREGSDLPKYLEVALSYNVSMNKLDQDFEAQIKKKP